MKASIKRMVSLLLCMVFLLALAPSVSAADTTTVQDSVKLTADTLGLTENQYSDGTAAVNGTAVEWTHLGNYGEGIQMKDEDEMSSMLWNTEALPGGITKIVFTYSSTREAWETENMFVRFSNEPKGSDYSTTMVTVNGYRVFSIFPSSTDYQFFYVEWFHNRASYWESIEVFYQADESAHTYQAEVTPPTCTEDGYTTYTCTQCGDSYVDNTVPATGHDFGYWYVEKEASCGENGVIARNCKNCTTKETDVLGAANHSYTSKVVAPTCLEQGCTIYTCTTCQSSYCDDYTDATGHSLGDWVIDAYPTCESKGRLYKECAYCDYRQEDVVAAVGHKFVNGRCTTCGVSEGVEITMRYPSLSFEDEIFYNVYFTVSDMSDVAEMGLITFDSRLADGTISDAVDVIPGFVSSDSVCMVRSKGIPAKKLGDALYFKVYAKLSDGSYVYSDVAGYHAVAYANTVLGDANASAKAKALVVAMLNYGAAAQEYFGYNPDSLMNANLTAQQLGLVSAYDESMVQGIVKAEPAKVGTFVMNGGYSDIYPTVSFEGAFSVNFYFTPEREVDAPPVLYYWDAETYGSVDVLTPENATGVITMAQDGSNWGAAVEGIAAKALDDTIYVAGFYSSDGVAYPTDVIAYSLGSYCKTLADSGEAFGTATAVYGFYAKTYFA